MLKWSCLGLVLALLGQVSPAVAQAPEKGSASPKAAEKSDKTPGAEESDAEVILLAGLPVGKGNAEIVSYARRTYLFTDLILDAGLQQMTRMALTKIEENPKNCESIKAEHLGLVSHHFLKQAMEGQARNMGLADVLNLAQIAVRCQPSNAKAKLFYSNILHSNLGRTDDAIQTLQHGLEFLSIDDPLAKDYIERYFQFLQLRERDHDEGDGELRRARARDETAAGHCRVQLPHTTHWYTAACHCHGQWYTVPNRAAGHCRGQQKELFRILL